MRGRTPAREELPVLTNYKDKVFNEEHRELFSAIDELTPKEAKAYNLLVECIDVLGHEGVDVSFFPHAADMVLIAYAKSIAKEL